MKKFFSFLVIALSAPIFAQNYGDAGCGLGSVIFGNKPGFVQIFAATTNAFFNSQLFGITSGTSNCRGLSASAKVEQSRYAEANHESLRQDVARGEGERLQNFAALFGCQADSQEYFARFAQNNYDYIFANDARGAEVVNRFSSLAQKDTLLNQSCRLLN